jgi:SWI/SNF related-matrix-associated actin-dependent regulator of chromatin subfamily C
MDLCANCYSQGKFPENLSSAHFVKMDTPIEQDPGDWTDQETLLLLEALERYNDNWDLVADHVVTKTKEQCLLHFLRLPIEDPYLEDNLSKAYTKPKETTLPFSEADNPLMSMIAFLSSVVSPNVAAAAAQSALSVFLKQRKEEQAKKNGDHKEDSMKVDTTVQKEGESMEVDKPADMKAEADSSTDKAKENSVDKDTVKAAATAALAAAALKAQVIAEKEERDMHAMVAKVIELQMKKLELKMRNFEMLEASLERERIQVIFATYLV